MQRKIRNWHRFVGLIVLTFLWLGCAAQEPTPAAVPVATSPATPQPTPQGVASANTQPLSVMPTPAAIESTPVTEPRAPYPAPGEGGMARAYPAPEGLPVFSADEPKFSLDEPLTADATGVSGQGPSGVEIAIVDVTLMAETLGTGMIGEDNAFTITVDPPLKADHLVGITVLTIRGEEISAENVVSLYPFAGDQARDIPHPQIDLLWDTATVVAAD
jgi:hypothetical protein